MKAFIWKLAPGVAFVAALFLMVGYVRAQAEKPAPVAHVAPRPVVVEAPRVEHVEHVERQDRRERRRQPSPEAARLEPRHNRRGSDLVVCGGCGVEVGRPAVVRVMAPINRGPGSFYGLPPMAPVGYGVPAYYGGGECAPRYYGSPGSQSEAFRLNTAGYLPNWR